MAVAEKPMRMPPGPNDVPTSYLASPPTPGGALDRVLARRVPPTTGTGYEAALVARARVTPRTLHSRGHDSLGAHSVEVWTHPVPASPEGISFGGPLLHTPAEALVSSPSPDAWFHLLPNWVTRDALSSLRLVFRAALTDRRDIWIPGLPAADIWGHPGESLSDFRARMQPRLDQAAAMAGSGTHLDARIGAEQPLWDKKRAQLRELLEMDRRELAALKAQGADPKALARKTDAIKVRIAEFKQLERARTDALSELEWQALDAKTKAVERLGAAELVEARIAPQDVEVTWLGIVWVPDR